MTPRPMIPSGCRLSRPVTVRWVPGVWINLPIGIFLCSRLYVLYASCSCSVDYYNFGRNKSPHILHSLFSQILLTQRTGL